MEKANELNPRHIAQIIRRNMITKVKPNKKKIQKNKKGQRYDDLD